MIRLNLLWIVDLAGSTRPLSFVRAGEKLDSAVFAHAQAALMFSRLDYSKPDDERAIAQFTHELIPKITAAANALLEVVERFMPLAVQKQRLTLANAQELWQSVQKLFDALEDELGHAYAFSITEQRMISVRVMLDNPAKVFAQGCWDMMPSLARGEAAKATRCLAFDCPTACGFHILRSVEATIRRYIQAATGSLPAKRDWGHYVTVLRENGADQKAAAVVDQIRELERNPLMHPEDVLDNDQAVDLLILCGAAINRLTSDMSKRQLVKRVGALE